MVKSESSQVNMDQLTIMNLNFRLMVSIPLKDFKQRSKGIRFAFIMINWPVA